MIYAVHILRSQFIKIGYSQHEDVKKRIAELQTGCPFEICPLFTIAGTLLQEKSLHAGLLQAFAQIRVPMPPNEWYPGRHPFFQRFLGELRFGADIGLAFCHQNDHLHYSKDVKPNTTERHNLVPNLKWPHKADFTLEYQQSRVLNHRALADKKHKGTSTPQQPPQSPTA